MKTTLALLFSLPALVAFGTSAHVLTPNDVSRALLEQMNSSPAGHITQKVSCHPAARANSSPTLRYTCTLVGRRASQRVYVTVNGTSWRAEFAPLQG